MAVEAIAIALHHSSAKGAAKLVLIGIANHAGDGGAWPSMSTLARYAGVTRDAARRCVQQLIKAGEVSRAVQAGGHARMPEHERPNRYEFLLTCPEWCDRTLQHRDTRRQADPTLPGLEPVDNTPQSSGPPIQLDAPPSIESAGRTILKNQPPTDNLSSHLRDRAGASLCTTTGQAHRWNRKHRWCADCSAPMGAAY